MEIERKFLIDWKEIDALGLPLVKQAQSWQGYLSAATPVVRIRKRDFSDGHTDYILCIKGKGKLAREEIEKELTPQEFSALEAMLPIPMIHKDYRVYRLPGWTSAGVQYGGRQVCLCRGGVCQRGGGKGV